MNRRKSLTEKGETFFNLMCYSTDLTMLGFCRISKAVFDPWWQLQAEQNVGAAKAQHESCVELRDSLEELLTNIHYVPEEEDG